MKGFVAMSLPNVFVTREIPTVGLKLLNEHFSVDVWTDRMPPSRDELLRRCVGMSGLLTLLSDTVDGEVMDTAGKSLRVISNFAVGYNNIDVAAAQSRGIRVGNTPDVLTDATADIAVGLLLAAARRFKESAGEVTCGLWKTWEPTGLIGADLCGRTLGIVGMGRIGLATARRLSRGWGMRVVYTARSAKPEVDAELNAMRVDFDTLLAQSDFVSIHTDLNPQTTSLFNATTFAKMKPTSVIVNTSRGGVIDQDALVHALRSGQIRAAGLDVTSPEPLLATHPLVGLPNCFILPHIGSATDESRDAMARIAAENLIAGVNGTPLRCPVA
jgi:glyoxylate reductase